MLLNDVLVETRWLESLLVMARKRYLTTDTVSQTHATKALTKRRRIENRKRAQKDVIDVNVPVEGEVGRLVHNDKQSKYISTHVTWITW